MKYTTAVRILTSPPSANNIIEATNPQRQFLSRWTTSDHQGPRLLSRKGLTAIRCDGRAKKDFSLRPILKVGRFEETNFTAENSAEVLWKVAQIPGLIVTFDFVTPKQ